MRELLPVLDDLERALDAANEHEEAKLSTRASASCNGTSPTCSREGARWRCRRRARVRPALAGGAAGAAVRCGGRTVIQVLQKGYKLGDHVLRPARAVISQGNGERA
jgi:hypothetical protein